MGDLQVKQRSPSEALSYVLEWLERSAIERGQHPVLVHTGMQALDKLDARIKELEKELAAERYAREQIEQRCDPAGDTRELILLRDENASLRALAGEEKSGG